MRHSNHNHILGVKKAHRAALMSNLCAQLFTHKRIKTTLAKAKALRPYAEKVITLAKKAHSAESATAIHHRRNALRKVRDRTVVNQLFSNESVSAFLDRPGGYTRIYKLVRRKGDGAEMALIEVISAEDKGYPKRSRSKKGALKSKEQKKSVEAKPVKVAQEVASTDGSEQADAFPEGEKS